MNSLIVLALIVFITYYIGKTIDLLLTNVVKEMTKIIKAQTAIIVELKKQEKELREKTNEQRSK